MAEQQQEQLNVDVAIVGSGIAGLACAIHLARHAGEPMSILVLEKSSKPGGHLLSGAVMRSESLKHLLTEDEFSAMPFGPAVKKDTFHALLPKTAIRLPFVPPKMRMKGLPLVSAGRLGEALASVASSLGVELMTGQTADALIWEDGRVAGVQSDGETIRAEYTVIADGPEGLLSRDVYNHHPHLRGQNLTTNAIGLKELIEIPAALAKTGSVVHTFGYPLPLDVYGGGFLYHIDDTHIALGLAIALDYKNPALNPHDLFREWKRHPLIQQHIAGGKAVAYGARLIPEGGWYSISGMQAPGAYVIGDAAGLVDVMELKGLHLAVESGMAAANAILKRSSDTPVNPADIPSLKGVRKTANYRACFRGGVLAGMAGAGAAWLTGGLLPFGRIPQRDERRSLQPLKNKPATPASAGDQGPLDFGLDSDLYLANLTYRPGAHHIKIKDQQLCIQCGGQYDFPCTRFCPAGVYEKTTEGAIHARSENCLQCRCCTLKCPWDNIDWQTPQHGDGPAYTDL